MEIRDQIDADTYRSRLSEEDFQHTIELTLKQLGYWTYHTHDSRRSDPGFPDLVVVGNGREFKIELKVGRNQPTDAQLAWLHHLADNGSEAYLVYPKDWDDLIACLAGRPHSLTQGPRPHADWQARQRLKREQRGRRQRSQWATTARAIAGGLRFVGRVASLQRRRARATGCTYQAPAGRSPPYA